MSESDLAGRRVVVWGVGGEGRAAARAALRAGARDVAAVVDGEPAAEELGGWVAAGLGAVSIGTVDGGTVDGTVNGGRVVGARVVGGVEGAEVVLLSPAVSRYRPEVLALEAAGVLVTSGTELFMASHGARTVAVTGSKGKSTVTRLTAHLLAAAGVPAVAAGNIGTPLLDLAPGLPAATTGHASSGPVVVAEVSSYQAAFVGSPARVAVLTSLFPDHLPWHGGVERYYADKLRLFGAQLVPGGSSAPRTAAPMAAAHRSGTALVNAADDGVRALWVEGAPAGGALAGAEGYGGGRSRVRVDQGPDGQHHVLVDGVPALGLARCRLPGAHNRVNVAAAVAVLDALGVPVARERGRLEEALAGFAPLPHRLEPVATVAGVTFVDDSLATSAQAAVAACEAYAGRALTLLAGGLDRGIDYEPLVRYLGRRAGEGPLTVVAMGAAGARLAEALPGVAMERTDDVAEAVRLAAKLTPAGGVVLFSPAAPSPAEYGTYARRSAVFAAAVRELAP